MTASDYDKAMVGSELVGDAAQRRAALGFSRDQLRSVQLKKFNQLLTTILPENQFYAAKLGRSELQLSDWEGIWQLPWTTKPELSGRGDSPFAANRTWPVDCYSRLHRTSGTKGEPLIVLDTPADWSWWLGAWEYVLDAAGVGQNDRAVMAFSFGPFVGFWSAFEAVVGRGAMIAPGGGLSTLARLHLLKSIAATVLFCTPSYALHMAESAAEHDVSLGDHLRAIVVAGEPGGSLPAVRATIERSWKARVYDHAGSSEVGPWGFNDPQRTGVYVNEFDFLCEFISLQTGQSAAENELSELVLTTLGRCGSPVIRYRTGDLVRPVWNHGGDCGFVLLQGGVLGRVDDMMIIRGVNVYPSAVEEILRSFDSVSEFRLTASKSGAMDQLKIEVEDRENSPQRIARQLHLQLGLRVDVRVVPANSLPRFELKGNRFIDERST